MLPSEKFPVAINCLVDLRAMVGFAGVTVIEVKVTDVTVSLVFTEIFPNVALMKVCPRLTDVANPFDPAALLIVATLVAEELQDTAEVRSCVLPFEKVPVAVNCWVVPRAIFGVLGVTAIEVRVADVTVRVKLFETILPDAAVIVVEPLPTAVASPLAPPALLTVATAVFEEFQVTNLVISRVLLSV